MPVHVSEPDWQSVTTADRFYLCRQLQNIQRRQRDGLPVDVMVRRFREKLRCSQRIVCENNKRLPKPESRADLPVNQRWHDIASVIDEHQVVIICGHTGSGKTTQIPQICLSLGLGARGLIGHTQPRRLAARSVAARIAEELNTTLGKHVGYQVRFDKKRSRQTRVILQTDGMLLFDIQQDKYLSAYEVIIIDEAHERSLNIDFLLGYLRYLLPKRPDLKVIITSATIDSERLATHFNQAPVITVAGKTFPVETLYRPLCSEAEDKMQDIDTIDGICRAIRELDTIHYGDTLVFLPTERDIRETADVLAKLNLRHTEILSLFARQTMALQQAIFHPKSKRRIILATNIAETSVTVPRILNVIDTGTARISRYSQRSKIQRLPIEPIAKASAAQRQGRCGRIAEGVCIRLYSEVDFNARPEFTDPEIKRTALAAVILQMQNLGLDEIGRFPFVDPPDHKMISDGYRLLFELQAIDAKNNITPLGRAMVNLRVDPRFAAILLYAKRHAVLGRVLPIVVALIVGDIKERPHEKRQQADTAHRRFAHQQSDFLFFTEIFEHLYPLFKKSHRQARTWAKKHYLSVLRVREWFFLIEQLAEQLEYSLAPNDLNTGVDTEAVPCQQMLVDKYANDYQRIHEALVVGFLDHVGAYQPEEKNYIGVRNKQFYLFPGSFLFKKQPRHIMCAEIVESSQVYARQVAKIDLNWLVPLCRHLSKTVQSEPFWSKKQGNVMAKQTTLLYGLPIVTGQLVPYARSHPEAAHDIFVEHGLVANAIDTTVPEIAENRRVFDKLYQLEEKTRHRDILIDEVQFAKRYFAVLPQTLYSAQTLKAWYAKASAAEKKALLFAKSDFLLKNDYAIDQQQYPNALWRYGKRLALTYVFDPSAEDDGVTVSLPLAMLNTFSALDFDYLVPALLPDKITALIRSLPKRYRRQFVPIADHVQPIVVALATRQDQPPADSLIDAIIKALKKQTGIVLNAHLFDTTKLEKHLLMNLQVLDEHGKIMATGRDLRALQKRFHQAASAQFDRDTQAVFGDIYRDVFPESIAATYTVKGKQLVSYPALTVVDGGYKIALFEHRQAAAQAHRKGVLAFLQARLSKEIAYIKKHVLGDAKLALAYHALAAAKGKSRIDVLTEISTALLLQHYLSEVPRSRAAVESIINAAKKSLFGQAQEIAKTVFDILHSHRQARDLLNTNRRHYDDIDKQLSRLVYCGFIAQTSGDRLPDIARYVKGIVIRLQKAALDPQKDFKWLVHFEHYNEALHTLIGDQPITAELPSPVLDFAYGIEEYHLSIVAQGQVMVKGKASEKRLSDLLKATTC